MYLSNNQGLKFTSFKSIGKHLVKNAKFLFIISFVIFLVYANSINGAFISDDIPTFVNSELVKNFEKSLSTFRIHDVLHAINYNLFSVTPASSHITSVVLHIISVVLAFVLLSTLLKKREAIFASILFALHPLCTEPVSWISGRPYILISIFIFLTLITYSLYKNSKQKKYLVISVLVYIVSLITIQAPQLLVVPLILAVYDQFFLEEKFNLKKLVSFTWFLLPSIFFISTFIGAVSVRKEEFAQASPYIQRLIYSIYKTITLLVWPADLSFFHEFYAKNIWHYYFMIGVFISFVIYLVVLLKKDRFIAGLILLILASSAYFISPYLVTWLIADRYLYFAVLPFSAILVVYLRRFEDRFNIKNFTLTAVLAISVFYSVRVVVRNNDWSTNKNLWKSTISVYPVSVRGYNNLGAIYLEEGNYVLAIEQFERALYFNPKYYRAAYNLGNTFFQKGDLQNAIISYKRALQNKPDLYSAEYNIARSYLQLGDWANANIYAQRTLDINPKHEGAEKILSELN